MDFGVWTKYRVPDRNLGRIYRWRLVKAGCLSVKQTTYAAEGMF